MVAFKGPSQEKSPGETEVTTVSRVNITGILAQMGRGMVQDVSDQMFQIFSQNMRTELEAAAPTQPSVPPAPAAAPPQPQALDVGSIGARAAARRPGFWVAVAVAAAILYLLFR